MDDAVRAALPADAAVLVAAVADWRVEPAPAKLKKADGPPGARLAAPIPTSSPASTPIRAARACSSASPPRPTTSRREAAAKRGRKGCDWILANDVSGDVMGGDSNRIHFIAGDGAEDWETMSKAEVARRLAAADRRCPWLRSRSR